MPDDSLFLMSATYTMNTSINPLRALRAGSFRAVVLGFCLAASVATAQDRWSWEFRPGAGFPTKKLGDANLKTGFGLEGTVTYRFLPHLGVYGGWSWNHFEANRSFAGPKAEFEETGYTAGLEFLHPICSSKVSLLLRAGAVYNHIEAENDRGDCLADTGHGLGWRSEVGIAIPLGEQWRLQPSVRFHALSRDMKIGTATTSLELNYVSVSVGLSRTF